MKPLSHHVLRALADGRFRSGEAVARMLGVSRASVWHAIRDLEGLGLEIYKVRGRGYRLEQPLSLLDPDAIRRHLGGAASRLQIDFSPCVGSTNSVLLTRTQEGAPSGTVAVAEFQNAGRGRQGRPWYAMPGAALTLSLLWRFPGGANTLAGLSLAVGVALRRAMTKLGARGVGLKWPNDLMWRGGKLAGILIELQGDALGPTAAVIGIGINVRLPEVLRRRIEQEAADLESACGRLLDRNEATAEVLLALVAALGRFASDGFAAFQDEWVAAHVYEGQQVTVILPDSTRETGIARGIDREGALLLDAGGRTRRFHSGEVRLRAGAQREIAA